MGNDVKDCLLKHFNIETFTILVSFYILYPLLIFSIFSVHKKT